MQPTGLLCVVPSRLQVGEQFQASIKVLGTPHIIPPRGLGNRPRPSPEGPFNLNVQRKLAYTDNALPEWSGILEVGNGSELDGPPELEFDGVAQGAYPKDRRPIKAFGGLCWNEPGFQFLRLHEPTTGREYFSNPVYVTEEPPERRIYWGDPHWQTVFSDGLRCPEELYAFARYEAFLDFGAITDHSEALTDLQWDYFTAVTNACDEPGSFATLVGQEWSNGRVGHRNVYFRGDRGPIVRSSEGHEETLNDLWSRLDAFKGEALAIPHHSANVIMGCDWSLGWNPKYEKAVEIYSCWGNSERHAEDGNHMPIENCDGEERGRHVVDALKKGYRFGFVGGGDIHDGRPGDAMHNESFLALPVRWYPNGLTACLAPELSRAHIYDATKGRQTYATTGSRIYLEVDLQRRQGRWRLDLRAASEEGLREVAVVRNGNEERRLTPEDDPMVLETETDAAPLQEEEFLYVRVTTELGRMAWSSPCWGADE